MNDLGTLATEIVDYQFPDDTGRFPVAFVSGWLNVNLGQFNGLTKTDFIIDSSGNFSPSLCPVESGILKEMYEIEYYSKAAKEALRGIVWGSASGADSITMVKEGDSVVQKVSKHQISRTFSEFARLAKDDLEDLLNKYNRKHSRPRQVAGEDGYRP